jgi:hypothetical protein
MNENLASLNEKIEMILDIGWEDIATSVVYAFAGITTVATALKLKMKSMTTGLKEGTRTTVGQSKLQERLGIGRKIDGPPGTPQAQRVGSGSPSAGTGPGTKAGAASGAGGSATQTPVRTGTGSPSAGTQGGYKPGPNMTTSSGTQVAKTDVRTAAAKTGKFTMGADGKLRGPNGGTFASDADALAALEKGLNPQYSKVFSRLVKLFKAVKIVAAVYLMYEIYVILEDDKTYPTRDSKIQAMAPLIGSIVGGLGGAAIGAAMGSIPPLTGWGTLIGGVLGGLLGGFAGNYFGEVIAKWAFEKEPDDKDRQDISQQQVKKMPTGGHDKRNWLKKYGKTHNADGTPMMVGPVQPQGTGNNTAGNATPSSSSTSFNNGMGPLSPEALANMESSGTLNKSGGGNSVGELLGLTPSSFTSDQKQVKLDIAAKGGGAPSINVVNTPSYQSSPVVVQNGGSDVTQISVSGSGSGGDGKSTTIYGVTGSIN